MMYLFGAFSLLVRALTCLYSLFYRIDANEEYVVF